MDEKQLLKDAKTCTRWALSLTVVLIILWPGVMFLTGYEYSLTFFKGWAALAFTWLIVAGTFITALPIVEARKAKKAGQ